MAAALVAGSVLSAVNAVLRDRMEELFNTVATAIRDRETFMYNLQTVSEINTGRTALHVAAVNGIVDLAERLVGASQPERLALPDAYGDTPLSLAAYSGSFAIVKLLLRKNENLISIPNTKRKVIPVVAACNEGHKHITKYLYHRTELDLLRSENGYYGSMLLSSAVKNDMLDIALDLVQRCPDLIFSGNDATLGLLSTLAETPSLFLSGCQLGFAQRLDYHLS